MEATMDCRKRSGMRLFRSRQISLDWHPLWFKTATTEDTSRLITKIPRIVTASAKNVIKAITEDSKKKSLAGSLQFGPHQIGEEQYAIRELPAQRIRQQ
jgi:hypothetical protein